MTMPDFQIVLWGAFSVSVVICAILVRAARRWPERLVPRADLRAVQAAHRDPTARLGGVAILLGLMGGMLLLGALEDSAVLKLLLVSLIPVVLAGLAEDLGFMVSPGRRMVAAILSSFLAVLLFQLWVVRVDLAGLDAIFAIAALAIPLTLLWGGGICHAFNLIDGVNGLSSGVALLAALGLGAIAALAAEPGLAVLAWLLAAVTLGFMLFNWPTGRLFLGDTGAYMLGHLLTWLGIILLVRVPEMSFAALIGLFFWPLADTALAIYRRSLSGRRLDQPDRLHFHQLVMRGLEIGVIGRGRRHISNPATTALILPLVALGVVGHVALWNLPWAGYLLLAVQAATFLSVYLLGMRFFSKPRKRRIPGTGITQVPALLKRAG